MRTLRRETNSIEEMSLSPAEKNAGGLISEQCDAKEGIYNHEKAQSPENRWIVDLKMADRMEAFYFEGSGAPVMVLRKKIKIKYFKSPGVL